MNVNAIIESLVNHFVGLISEALNKTYGLVSLNTNVADHEKEIGKLTNMVADLRSDLNYSEYVSRDDVVEMLEEHQIDASEIADEVRDYLPEYVDESDVERMIENAIVDLPRILDEDEINAILDARLAGGEPTEDRDTSDDLADLKERVQELEDTVSRMTSLLNLVGESLSTFTS